MSLHKSEGAVRARKPKTSSRSARLACPSRPKPRSTAEDPGRVFLTLLAFGLAGALAYVLYHLVPAGIHLAVLPVSDSDVLTLPPIPYSRENADSLRDLDLHPPVLDLHDIQTADAMSTLAGKLREGTAKERYADRLPNGQLRFGHVAQTDRRRGSCAAIFRCSTGVETQCRLKPRIQPQAGRYRLRDLLGQLKQCTAKSKLLVLDTGYLNYDPRMGLFVNEFPRLLAEDVKAVNDPDLWVLSSCRPLESSHVCGPDKRSVFNYFVTKGFTGAATRSGRWVDSGTSVRLCAGPCGGLGRSPDGRRGDANALALALRRRGQAAEGFSPLARAKPQAAAEARGGGRRRTAAEIGQAYASGTSERRSGRCLAAARSTRRPNAEPRRLDAGRLCAAPVARVPGIALGNRPPQPRRRRLSTRPV